MTFKELKPYTKKLNLLYIEDELDVRKETTVMLKDFFNEVDVAVDAVEANKKYDVKSFDLVLCDIQLPKKNGFELSRELLKKNPEQKIILISGHNRDDIKPYMDELGLNYLLSKPFEYQGVLHLLHEIIKE